MTINALAPTSPNNLTKYSGYTFQLNPKNWGLTDYSAGRPFDAAYAEARRNGEPNFLWNGKRYGTQYQGSPKEQLATTGITDERIQDRAWYHKNLAKNLFPFGYAKAQQRAESAIYGEKDPKRIEMEALAEGGVKSAQRRLDVFSLYMGEPQKYGTAKLATHKPSKGVTNPNDTYYSVTDDDLVHRLTYIYNKPEKDIPKWDGEIRPVSKTASGNLLVDDNVDRGGGNVMGAYTVSKGKDKRGEYVSYHDRWDLTKDIGKPMEIYDRIYLKDYSGTGYKQPMYYTDEELKKLDPNTKNFDTKALQLELTNRGINLPKSKVGYKMALNPEYTQAWDTYDGILGPETISALKTWQSKNKR